MTKPCIITVAITGSVPRKEHNPAVPITIAEQVETPEVLALLAEYGIDYAQGYYIERPIPITEILETNIAGNLNATTIR